MYTLSVLASGAGSTLDNLAFHCYNEMDGMVRGFLQILQVVVDRPCKAIDVAHKWNIPVKIVERANYETDEKWSEALFGHQQPLMMTDGTHVDPDGQDTNLYVMAGFLAKVIVPDRLKNRVVNIHPSLLPAYGGKGMYGIKVHEAVVANKESVTGCTVHVVDNELDAGPILAQIKQAVLPWDNAASLQHAVQEMEKMLYPRAILNYCRGKN